MPLTLAIVATEFTLQPLAAQGWIAAYSAALQEVRARGERRLALPMASGIAVFAFTCIILALCFFIVRHIVTQTNLIESCFKGTNKCNKCAQLPLVRKFLDWILNFYQTDVLLKQMKKVARRLFNIANRDPVTPCCGIVCQIETLGDAEGLLLLEVLEKESKYRTDYGKLVTHLIQGLRGATKEKSDAGKLITRDEFVVAFLRAMHETQRDMVRDLKKAVKSKYASMVAKRDEGAHVVVPVVQPQGGADDDSDDEDDRRV